jgi:hypothetical protein
LIRKPKHILALPGETSQKEAHKMDYPQELFKNTRVVVAIRKKIWGVEVYSCFFAEETTYRTTDCQDHAKARYLVGRIQKARKHLPLPRIA